MKAKEVMKKYNITRRTLCNWVKKGVIGTEKTPTGRYIYFDKIIETK
jgi:predicted site-specific integrase-resolvase